MVVVHQLPALERLESNIDEDRWLRDVTDLHRIVDTMKTMWLSVQHTSEPIVRVALELVTSRYGKDILSWPVTWWPEEEKRKLLKSLVHSGLKGVLKTLKPDAQLPDPDEDDVVQEDTGQLAKEWEERFKKSQQAKEIIEMQLRTAQEEAESAKNRAQELEQSLQRFRDEIRQLKADLAAAAAAGASAAVTATNSGGTRLAAAERVAKDDVSQRRHTRDAAGSGAGAGGGSVSSPTAGGQLRLAAAGGIDPEQVAQYQQELAKHRRAISEYERKIADLERLLKESRERAEALAAAGRGGGGGGGGSPGSDERARLAEEAAERLRRELAEAKRAAEAALAEASDLQARLRRAETALDEAARAPAASPESPSAAARRQGLNTVASADEAAGEGQEQRRYKRSKADEDLLAQKDEEIAKLKERNVKQRENYKTLEAEKEKIDNQRLAALRLIRQLREQLKQLQELAEKRGLGTQVAEIMKECGLTKDIEEQLAVFERLWDDALRRIEKYRRIEQEIGNGANRFSSTAQANPGGVPSLTQIARMAAAGEPCPVCGGRLTLPLRDPGSWMTGGAATMGGTVMFGGESPGLSGGGSVVKASSSRSGGFGRPSLRKACSIDGEAVVWPTGGQRRPLQQASGGFAAADGEIPQTSSPQLRRTLTSLKSSGRLCSPSLVHTDVHTGGSLHLRGNQFARSGSSVFSDTAPSPLQTPHGVPERDVTPGPARSPEAAEVPADLGRFGRGTPATPLQSPSYESTATIAEAPPQATPQRRSGQRDGSAPRAPRPLSGTPNKVTLGGGIFASPSVPELMSSTAPQRPNSRESNRSFISDRRCISKSTSAATLVGSPQGYGPRVAARSPFGAKRPQGRSRAVVVPSALLCSSLSSTKFEQ